MAIKNNEMYPGRADNPSSEYPQGKARNRSSIDANDGMYLDQGWFNDRGGFFGALLTNAGLVPNGEIDTALNSQYFDALLAVIDGQTTGKTLNNVSLNNARKDGLYTVGTNVTDLPFPDVKSVIVAGKIGQIAIGASKMMWRVIGGAWNDTGGEVLNEWGDRDDATLSQKFLSEAYQNELTVEMFNNTPYALASDKYTSITELQDVFNSVEDAQLTHSLDFLAIQHILNVQGYVSLTKREYTLNETLRLKNNDQIMGVGKGVWDLPSHTYAIRSTDNSSCLMFYGEPTRVCKVEGVTSQELTGGVVQNPDSLDSTDKEYTLLNYHNENLRVAIDATEAQEISISNTMILKSYNGIDGYNDPSLTGLGDSYDIGVLLNNTSNNTLTDVNIVGYWLKAGMTVNSGYVGVKQGNAVQNRVNNCYIQSGLSIRSPDVLPVLSVSSNTITVPKSSNFILPENGLVIINSIVRNYILGNTIDDTIELILDNVTSISVNSEVRVNTTNVGHGGTIFDQCVIMGLFHTSRLNSTFFGLRQDTALEMSGFPLRNVKITNSYLLASDVIYQLHDTEDIVFDGNQFEAYGSKNADGTWYASGARCIVSGTIQQGFGKYSINGSTLVFHGDKSVYSAYTIDMFPYSRDSRLTRFTSSTGLFRPISKYVGGFGSGVNAPLSTSSSGTLLHMTGGDSKSLQVRDYDNSNRINVTNREIVFGSQKGNSYNNWERWVGYGTDGTYTLMYKDNPNSQIVLRWGGGTSLHKSVHGHVFYTQFGAMLNINGRNITPNLTTFNTNEEAKDVLEVGAIYADSNGNLKRVI